MAYDEQLEARVVTVLLDLGIGVTSKRMFGGVAFMLDGSMLAGILKDELMVRLGEPAAALALEDSNVRPMDFNGRAMRGMVFVTPAGTRTQPSLRAWLTKALEHHRSLPPKGATTTRTARRRPARG